MKKQHGFTLIEILVYLALFGIIMSGVFAGAFAVIESSGRNQTKALVQEEGNFILGKIGWVMSGATSISAPTVSCTAYCNTLTVSKWDGSVVSLSLLGTDIQQNGTVINNQRVKITSLTFAHTGSGSNPERIDADFTLTSQTPDGKTYSQAFSATKYLRK